MKVSRCQNYVAILTGKNLVKEIEELHQLIVYKINNQKDFELISKHSENHLLPEEFAEYSKGIEFSNEEEHCKILMSNNERIIKFDYTKPNSIEEVYKFNNRLDDQPDHIEFDET